MQFHRKQSCRYNRNQHAVRVEYAHTLRKEDVQHGRKGKSVDAYASSLFWVWMHSFRAPFHWMRLFRAGLVFDAFVPSPIRWMHLLRAADQAKKLANMQEE